MLTNLVDNILAGKPHLAVALNANAKKDSDRQLREAVMALRVAGLPLTNFDPYEAGAQDGRAAQEEPGDGEAERRLLRFGKDPHRL